MDKRLNNSVLDSFNALAQIREKWYIISYNVYKWVYKYNPYAKVTLTYLLILKTNSQPRIQSLCFTPSQVAV